MRRYLFNAGEGIQRFCGEYKIRPSRLSGVFLTRCTPAAMGGLAGGACGHMRARRRTGGQGLTWTRAQACA